MDQDDLKEIKQDVKEILQRTAVHNELLREHERRSLALEKRQDAHETEMAPIKQHVRFVDAGLKIIGSLALLALGQALLRWVGLLKL